jgi:hypothetical protein
LFYITYMWFVLIFYFTKITNFLLWITYTTRTISFIYCFILIYSYTALF